MRKTNKTTSMNKRSRVKNVSSPFYDQLKSAFEKYECQLLACALILEAKYDVKVYASWIVHLTDAKFDI